MLKPQDGYICCIVNPKSGASSGDKLPGQQFEQYLIDRGFEVRVNLTESLDHACELSSAAAVDSDCAMVVVVGGDGTVREVAHGLEGSDKPLLIIPGGTENLLANELGLDKRIKTLVRTFEAGDIATMDLGNANGKCFTSIAGFGFDGEVVRRVSENRRGHITYFDYFWPLWRTFWQYKFQPMDVVVDGRQIFEDRGLVFVGNISRYAVGLKILGRADYSDGLLDVCIYRCDSHLCLLKHSAMTVAKRHIRSGQVIYQQGSNIRISSDAAGIATEIDGDPGPALPVEIRIIPQAIRIVTPKGARPAGIRTHLFRLFR